jgi:hypothetical protein
MCTVIHVRVCVRKKRGLFVCLCHSMEEEGKESVCAQATHSVCTHGTHSVLHTLSMSLCAHMYHTLSMSVHIVCSPDVPINKISISLIVINSCRFIVNPCIHRAFCFPLLRSHPWFFCDLNRGTSCNTILIVD